MTNTLDIFYWDACIFFEFLKEEQTDPYKKQAIVRMLQENKDKRNRLCTSTITHVEVLPKKLPPDKERNYWGNFTSTFFYDIPADRSVIQLAREIKDFYYQEGQPPKATYKMLSTGDALHLATAIIHNVSEFHTRDNNSRNGNVKLLGLPESSPNGKICGKYELKILSPADDQVPLIT